MANLLNKVSTLLSANLHALMDQAMRMNSPAILDQYIRQVEQNLTALEDAATTVGGEVKSLQRKVGGYAQERVDVDRAITAFLTAGNDAAAIAAQTKLNHIDQMVGVYQQQAAQQDAEFQSLLGTKVKLEARLATIRQERDSMQSLLELAKSKEISVKAMNKLNDLGGTGDADIKRLSQDIYARLDKAAVASEMQSNRLGEQMYRVLDEDNIQLQLAERRKLIAASEE